MRIQGWEQALFETTTLAMKRPHEWGVHDCATFAADCVEAMTGIDPIADLRGHWQGPVSARRLIAEEGADTLGDLAAQRLPEIAPSMARRGDVVLCKSDGTNETEFLAICQGHTAVGPAAHGLIHVPMTQALRAFRVGA
ncbi:MAG TPA: hypothetical protein PLR76_15055 [Hyphomonas sp.]|nr:hypothetical protein [Hyphomonas sp.]